MSAKVVLIVCGAI